MENSEDKVAIEQTTITKSLDADLGGQVMKFQRKWLGIGHGVHEQKSYQYVYRCPFKKAHDANTKKRNDGLQIVPIIEYPDHQQLVFIANFRPPVGKFVVQFPAGLADSEDNIENARRQLEQQVGLVPYKFVQMSGPVIYTAPHSSNQSGIFYIALIDGSKHQSFVPFKRQHGENIRCYSMKYQKDGGICEMLQKFAQQHEYIIQAKTWIVCMTVDLVQRLKAINISI